MGGINKEKEKEKSCSNSHNKGQQNTSGDFCDGLSIVGWYIQMNNKIVDAQFFPLWLTINIFTTFVYFTSDADFLCGIWYQSHSWKFLDMPGTE